MKKTTKRFLKGALMDVLIYTSMQIVILGIGILLSTGGSLKEKEPVEMVHVKITQDEFATDEKDVREFTHQESVETSEIAEIPEAVEREITLVSAGYNDADLEILAQLMYAEEGVLLSKYEEEPEKVERVFKLAGSVAIRRMEHNYRGAKTLKDVVYSEGQYALKTVQKVRQGQDVPNIVYVWAKELLTEGPIGPKGLIYQAEFKQGKPYDTVYNQEFGVDEKYN